jgi:predicted nucleic acid-binding protein
MRNTCLLSRITTGVSVRHILEVHADTVSFFVLELAYNEAEEHLEVLVRKRRGDPSKALAALRATAALATIVGDEIYADFEGEARKRLGPRDPDDWPILATPLALACPVWTEVTDFFGCGVATRTSASIEVFLAQ